MCGRYYLSQQNEQAFWRPETRLVNSKTPKRGFRRLLAELILLFVVWLTIRTTNSAYQHNISSQFGTFEHNAPVEVHTNGQKYEVAGLQRHELGAKDMVAEMSVSRAAWELLSGKSKQ